MVFITLPQSFSHLITSHKGGQHEESLLFVFYVPTKTGTVTFSSVYFWTRVGPLCGCSSSAAANGAAVPFAAAVSGIRRHLCRRLYRRHLRCRQRRCCRLGHGTGEAPARALREVTCSFGAHSSRSRWHASRFCTPHLWGRRGSATGEGDLWGSGSARDAERSACAGGLKVVGGAFGGMEGQRGCALGGPPPGHAFLWDL